MYLVVEITRHLAALVLDLLYPKKKKNSKLIMVMQRCHKKKTNVLLTSL